MLATEGGEHIYRASASGGVGDVLRVVRESYQELLDQGAELPLKS